MTLALDVFPVPALDEDTVTLLFCTPAAVPVTFTANVQEPPAASVAAARLTDEVPPAAVNAPPPQVPVKPFGVETANPAGSESVNETPVRGTVLTAGLLTVNVSVVDPFNGILAAPNALVIAGGLATVKLAVAVLPVPPLVEFAAPVVLV